MKYKRMGMRASNMLLRASAATSMYYARMLDARATLNATWKPRRQVETTCSCECRCMFHILWEFDVLEEDGGSHPHEISFKDLFGCVVFLPWIAISRLAVMTPTLDRVCQLSDIVDIRLLLLLVLRSCDGSLHCLKISCSAALTDCYSNAPRSSPSTT